MASVVNKTCLYPQVINCQEGGTPADFHIGDLLKTDSSGQVVMATAGYCWAIALKEHTDTQATIIPVELINFHDIYSIAVGAASVTAQADVGEQGNITFTAEGHTVASSSSGTDVEICGIDPCKPVGTTGAAGGRYLVRFLRTNLGRA